MIGAGALTGAGAGPGAPLTSDAENLAIWELADALESELMEIEEGAKRAMKLLRPLLKLAPHE